MQVRGGSAWGRTRVGVKVAAMSSSWTTTRQRSISWSCTCPRSTLLHGASRVAAITCKTYVMRTRGLCCSTWHCQGRMDTICVLSSRGPGKRGISGSSCSRRCRRRTSSRTSAIVAPTGTFSSRSPCQASIRRSGSAGTRGIKWEKKESIVDAKQKKK